jgi:S-adenosylmethionine:tRNA ribosyltransferase-isomerase
VQPRDAARLLDVAPDGLHDRTVRDLPALLRRGDLLVFNDTKVIPARLKGVRGGTAGRQDVAVEALLIRDLGRGRWLSFSRPTKRLRPGDGIAFTGFGATVEAKNEDGSIVLAFDTTGPGFLATLEQSGAVPLPPYIRGGVADAQDRADYQTMFARYDGSVAAPTAGLHFTPELLASLTDAGIATASVTLHVGAGTFQPVRVDDTDAEHTMHAEWGEVPEATARAIAETRQGRPRRLDRHDGAALLESHARRDGVVSAWTGETDIFITPGYRFRPSTCC